MESGYNKRVVLDRLLSRVDVEHLTGEVKIRFNQGTIGDIYFDQKII